MARRGRRQRLPDTEFHASVQDLAHDGRGVVRDEEGKTVFVHGALPDEEVAYKLTGKHRQYDEGRLTAVEKASDHRVVPRCEHFGVCNGCALQHLDPVEQIRFKHQRLMENFKRIGHVEPESEFEPLLGPLWGYRRKARLSAKYVRKKEKLLLGFREINGRFVADIEHCHVLVPELGLGLPKLREFIAGMSINDQIPQLEIAVGDNLSAIVIRHLAPFSEEDLRRIEAFHAETAIHVYGQSKGPKTVKPLAPLASEPHTRIDDGHIQLDFSPIDFLQINATINEEMLKRAMELLDPQPEDRVLDLFCGLGNFSLPLARRVAEVTGVEGDETMVAKANGNAERNQISNVDFHAADLREPVAGLAWSDREFDKVLLDPPRSGAPAMLDYIADKRPSKLLYVSCDPATLARDAGRLVNELGYRLRGAGVMDMFPHTHHVESIALFEPA